MNHAQLFHELYRTKERATWPLCHVSALIVGTHTEATRELADSEGLNPSTIEHYAHASNCYRRMVHYPDYRAIRDELTVSHYAAVWEVCNLKEHPERASLAYDLLVRSCDPPDGRTRWTSQDIRQAARENLGLPIPDKSHVWINNLYSYVESHLDYDGRIKAIKLLKELQKLLRLV